MFTFGCVVFLMAGAMVFGFLGGCVCGGVVGPLEGKVVRFPGTKGGQQKNGQNQGQK
jgi:hypothetical protein